MSTPTNEYMRDYRSRNPDYVAEQNRRTRARHRALRRLGQRYRAELWELYQEELTEDNP